MKLTLFKSLILRETSPHTMGYQKFKGCKIQIQIPPQEIKGAQIKLLPLPRQVCLFSNVMNLDWSPDSRPRNDTRSVSGRRSAHSDKTNINFFVYQSGSIYVPICYSLYSLPHWTQLSIKWHKKPLVDQRLQPKHS